ncbi:translation initiation factor IF-6 [archaeon]|nr:translation initiation factor IF-6 [archaeon]
MNFVRGNMRSSPYVGIFCSLTEELGIVPQASLPKEIKLLEKELDINIVKTNLGQTSLTGILSTGIKKKIVVSNITENDEIKKLEKEGIEIMVLEGLTSTGNLIAVNKNGGIVSPLIKEKPVKDLGDFFKVKLEKMRIADNEVPGASITVTNKGFICHPNISEKDFSKLEKVFGVKGMATTANYGDLFVGNSVIANTNGVMVGSLTSGIELGKIDEGLRGE